MQFFQLSFIILSLLNRKHNQITGNDSNDNNYHNEYKACGGRQGILFCFNKGMNCDHAVRINCTDKYSQPIICSGSLIMRNNLVFTGGHCLKNVSDIISSCQIEMKPVWKNSDHVEIEYEVLSIQEHLYFGDEYDIGILIVNSSSLSPPLFSKSTEIMLPDSSIDVSFDALKKKNLTFCPFGLISENELAPEVKCMHFSMLDNSHCEGDDDNGNIIGVSSPHTFCAGVIISEGKTCRGDSGGGLIMEEDDGRRFLIGVLSNGENTPCSARFCENDVIGNVFTNVSRIMPMPEWDITIPPKGKNGEDDDFSRNGSESGGESTHLVICWACFLQLPLFSSGIFSILKFVIIAIIC